MERGAGITGFGKEVRHFLLLGREVVKVDTSSWWSRSLEYPGRRRVLNRVRGAVLFLALCKAFFETLANVVGDGRFLKPCLDIGKGFVGEAELGKENAGGGVRRRIITVA